MSTDSADEVVVNASHARRVGGRRRVIAATGPRMPSTAGYMAVAVAVATIVFFVVGIMLYANEDEAPWLLASLAGGGVLLLAAAARELVMRRAWSRYTRDMELEMRRRTSVPPRATTAGRAGVPSSVHASASALRKLQNRLSEAPASGASPEAHLEAYHLCEQYLADAEEAIRSAGGGSDVRAALRAGQERVRTLQKGHLLTWARGEATRLTQEAQRRVRLSDKIETAQRALGIIDEALRVYPSEPELHRSATAVRDFMASVKVGHWVEMAERAAFRGRYGRAIARYRDALFYLSRAEMGEATRDAAAERINREIELLRARVATDERTTTVGADYDIIVEGLAPESDGDGERGDAPGGEGQT
ncbi:MAG TPA: hypothetical protein VF240_00135 [Pyrinomonadaceae bacterium]